MSKLRLVRVFLALTAVVFAFHTGCGKPAADMTGTEKKTDTGSDGIETASETEEPSSETEEETLPPEPEYELKLSDTYKPNGITFSTFEVTAGELTVSCPSIGGLRDETVNRRINVGLFQHVIEEAENLAALYPEGITSLSSNSVLDASFANVISVRTTFIVEEAPGSSAGERPLVVEFSDNYELLTGHPFNLRELFREDCRAEDLFGDGRIEKSKVKDPRTLEELKTPLSEYADVSRELSSITAAFDRQEEIPFRFDEKEAVILGKTDDVFYEVSVPYLDHLPETVIYERFLTEEPIYENESEEQYPVLFKRFPSKHAVFENSGRAFVDAVLYAPDGTDGGILSFIEEDAAKRLDERIRAILDASENYVLYNAELSLYEMKNGFMNGRPAPFYISIREYVRKTDSETDFTELKNAAVDGLQKMSEEEAALRKTLFLNGEQYAAESSFAAWYYDEAGGFIEESALIDGAR